MEFKIKIEDAMVLDAISWARANYNRTVVTDITLTELKSDEEFIADLLNKSLIQLKNQKHQADVSAAIASLQSGDPTEFDALRAAHLKQE